MNKILFIAAILIFSLGQAAGQTYDTTRMYHVMDKARRGEPVTIVVLGGSITQGSLASSESKRWVNIMTGWWKTTFPNSAITLINAGIGGTGSDIGVFRLQRDVLSKKPDFVMVEFSVNDNSGGTYCEKMTEGIIRQLLTYDSLPGVMMLTLQQENGTTAKESHKKVAAHYNIPVVRFADSIATRLAADGKTLRDTYGDNPGVHPNDLGMKYISDFVIEELGRIHANLPASASIAAPNKTLPAPLVSDKYDDSFLYNATLLAPTTNTGWKVSGTNWLASTAGSETSFSVEGNAIAFFYTRHNTKTLGKVQAWVDDLPKKTFDGYWTETWGPSNQFALVAEGLPDGVHTLHVKVLETATAPSTGFNFTITSIGKAGNIGGNIPMAKILYIAPVSPINTAVDLNGAQSLDPDGEAITEYLWSVVSKPEGSSAAFSASDIAKPTFTPDVDGVYTLSLQVKAGSVASIPATVTFSTLETNVKTVSAIQLVISPNPAQSLITVTAPSAVLSAVIVSTEGTVFSSNEISKDANNEFTVSVADYPAGEYYITVSTPEGSYSSSFIKQ